ncbi:MULTISPECIES: helix-turn-helix domain-containing protein [unclassified Streptomyces]|uniref:helix-turn-helix domain-containing protein n=1 Tax=unclassified Streptomyces TaxID=2593676 RepID=UPI003866FEA5|nr:helix-turn-helix domain-containing protein [Streptomyces sp. NBC_00827]
MTQSHAPPLPSPTERRRLREAKSLSQADVADKMGVTRETVRSWETGRTTPRGSKREAYVELLTAQDPATTSAETEDRTGVEAEAETEVTARQEPYTEAEAESSVEAEAEAEADSDEEPAPPPPALTPPQAFDALYAFCTPALVRQTYLLTGRRELARESVERAFQLAWHRWPEVAVDRDPAGWVRATAYEYALSPWHRLRPRHRHPEAPPADAADRALLDVFLKLPPMYRRTLLLYDGVGLDLPETAAETEASTPAAANRLLHAREAVAERLPELAAPDELHRRLTVLAATERLRAAKPRSVRYGSEHRARTWTRAAIAFTVLLIGATSLTLRTAPDHYEPPMAPGATIRGVPPRAASGPLSDEQLELHAFLKSQTVSGPERLVPEAR